MKTKRMEDQRLTLVRNDGDSPVPPPAKPKKDKSEIRALTTEEFERVRARLMQLKDVYGTQKSAADRVGISQQVYGRILGGQMCGHYMARLVAEHDSMPVEWLLAGSTPTLEKVIRVGPKRWPKHVLNAVRTMAAYDVPNPELLTAEDWETALDITLKQHQVVNDYLSHLKKP